MKSFEEFNKKLLTITPDKELDIDQVKFLGNLILNPKNEKLTKIVHSEDPELDDEMWNGVKIMLKRLEAMSTIKLQAGVALLIGTEIEKPPQAVVYAYYIYKKLKPDTIVDVKVWGEQLFPMGMFSEKQMNELWALTKK